MQPLSDRIRPSSIEDIIGHFHLVANNKIIERIVKSKEIPSIILWGPAGCGKTTLAKIIAQKDGINMEVISATNSGAEDLRSVFKRAIDYKKYNQQTILFADEIHFFKKNQQDLLLPYIEDGTITLIGATTENPSFELNSALLSRCRVIKLESLTNEDLDNIISRAEKLENKKLNLTNEARKSLCEMSMGDARYLLNACEDLFKLESKKELNEEDLNKYIERKASSYDKNRDKHYEMASAFQKSIRGSDVQASLYWMARMLNVGEPVNFILRRMTVIAVEDIGMADPNAILQVNAARQAYEFVGSPEGELAISQAVVYLATSPKSNAQYLACKKAIAETKGDNFSPPIHILNAPTKMMQELDYKKDYIYDHDTPNCFSGQNYFPREIQEKTFYSPNERGFERDVKKRIEYWNKLKNEK